MSSLGAKIKKLLLPRPIFIPVIILLTGVIVFFVALPVNAAGLKAFLADDIVLPVAQFFGGLTLTLIGILVKVAEYNNFINVPAVEKGWVLLRDVMNMFFIVLLLVISFGTVFRWENYHYKKLLGKLMIMAVLVNFSKGITGLMIDFAQVVMLTFVNGFSESAAGNFIQGFHLDKMFQFASNKLTPEEARNLQADEGTFLIAALLALISIFISLIVIGVIVVVLIFRIVALWFLVIISPVAYTLNILPGQGQKYADMWWDYFGKYASTGPILAFFLWLSLYVMQITSGSALGAFTERKDASVDLLDIPSAAITGIGQSEILLSFLVNISLLIGALWITQQMGVAGGKLAGSAMNFIRTSGSAIAKSPFKGFTKTGAWATRKYKAATGIDLNPVSIYKSLKEGFARKKRKEEIQGIIASGARLEGGGIGGALGGLGAPGWVDNYARGFLWNKGLKTALVGRPEKFKEYDARAKEMEKLASTMTANEKAGKKFDLDSKLASVYGREKSQILDLQPDKGMGPEKRRELNNKRHMLKEEILKVLPKDEEIAELNNDAQKAFEMRDFITAKSKEDKAIAMQKEKKKYDKILKNIDFFNEIDDLEIKAEKLNKSADKKEQEGKDFGEIEKDRNNAKKLLQDRDQKIAEAAAGGQQIRILKLDDRLNFTKNWKKDLQAEREKIEQETAILESAPTITVEQRAEYKREADDAKQKASEAASFRPRDFIAQQIGRREIEEESRKYPTTNEHELMSLLRGALARNELYDAAAVAKQAARAYHLNEVIMDQQATEDYYYDSDNDEYNTEGRGELKIKKGEYLPAGVLGLHAFTNEVFIKKLGMDKKAAINFESDLSDIAQNCNHWTYAQATSVNEDGTPRQRGQLEQNTAVKMERSKADFEKRNREGNRLSTSTEYWNNPLDKNSGRYSVLNPYYLVELQESYPEMTTLIGRGRYNPNAAQNMIKFNMPLIEQMAIESNIHNEPKFVEFIKELRQFAGKDVDVKIESRLDDMRKLILRHVAGK
ncbi:MAG: hypothetical protein ABIJ81_02090 [Patescibacteria group bacterium]